MAQRVVAVETPLTTKIVKYWLPVMLMLAVMYYFSTDVFSGENTRGALDWILHWLWPSGTKHLTRINFIVRKSMHFVEYAVLAALVYRAFRADSPLSWRLKWALYSFALIVVWALLDEFHQSQTRRRGGTIYDSLIDSAGGLTMLILIGLINYRRRNAANANPDPQLRSSPEA
jgi:VanZ family protein